MAQSRSQPSLINSELNKLIQSLRETVKVTVKDSSLNNAVSEKNYVKFRKVSSETDTSTSSNLQATGQQYSNTNISLRNPTLLEKVRDEVRQKYANMSGPKIVKIESLEKFQTNNLLKSSAANVSHDKINHLTQKDPLKIDTNLRKIVLKSPHKIMLNPTLAKIPIATQIKSTSAIQNSNTIDRRTHSNDIVEKVLLDFDDIIEENFDSD